MNITYYESDTCPKCGKGKLESYEHRDLLFLGCDTCGEVIKSSPLLEDTDLLINKILLLSGEDFAIIHKVVSKEYLKRLR